MSDECPKCPTCLPGYLATFADLMSLLMCFFVLLLSFAQVDAVRFKKMADSLKDAFGVQREVQAYEIVKGVSVIKQEFSPSTVPEPSPRAQVRQETRDDTREQLDMHDGRDSQLRSALEREAERLRRVLKDEIRQGTLEVQTELPHIVVRISEQGSFSSGSAQLDPAFQKVMARISTELAASPGEIVVAGHTDDIPIATSRFRSNWELSAGRAVTVAHALLDNPALDPRRVVVEGHADSRPLVPNDSPAHRARNRRVEVILMPDKAPPPLPSPAS
jgi:chemotaxis protein MotB